jgi:hypothetical protein
VCIRLPQAGNVASVFPANVTSAENTR